MNETVVFGFLENSHRLIVGHVMASSCLSKVVRHIAHTDTPVAIVIRAAFIQFLTAVAARTNTYADMPFVFLEPIGDMLDIDALVFHRDGFLYRNDVHTDTRTAHRNHRGNLLQRQEGHSFEEHRQLRMTVHQLGVHIRIFSTTRHEHRHPILALFTREMGPLFVHCPLSIVLLRIFIPVVVFEHTEIRQFVQQFIETLIVRCVVFLRVHRV